MKTRMKQKRILALLLSFCMVFASLPAAAFAETQTAENITGDSVQKDLQQEEEQSEEDGYIANEYIVLHEDFFEKTDNGGFSVLDNGESELTQDITASPQQLAITWVFPALRAIWTFSFCPPRFWTTTATAQHTAL